MNIIVFGAGAIGSFFGAILAKENEVTLVGRKDHVNHVIKHGLELKGKTQLNVKLNAVEGINEITKFPELLLLTVKAYDTLQAIEQAKEIIHKKTIVLSFQNGLNNIDQIRQVVSQDQIVAGITTHGVQYIKPGVVYHKGHGSTVIGELSKKKTNRIQQLVTLFKESGISVDISDNIIMDIWKKAIVNAAINPLTTIFRCQNGYLSKNPILSVLVERIVKESVLVAQREGFTFTVDEMVRFARIVINQTEQNRSSMLQSIEQGKPTEISQINGRIADIGIISGCKVPLNLLFTKIIKSL